MDDFMRYSQQRQSIVSNTLNFFSGEQPTQVYNIQKTVQNEKDYCQSYPSQLSTVDRNYR